MSITDKKIIEADLPWDADDEATSALSVGSKALDPPPPAAPAPVPPPAPMPPSAAAARARAAHDAAVERETSDPFHDAAPPFAAAKEIDPLRIAELEALTPEIHLVSPDLGDIYLVKVHSSATRTELTFREAATLRQLVDQFPGARVVQLRPGAQSEPTPPAAAEGWDS
jgi:hypothetical protein